MAEVGLTEAAKLTGKDPSTIARRSNHPDMTKRLSYRVNDSGERLYDVSELERVFGALKSPDAIAQSIANNDAQHLQINALQDVVQVSHSREVALLQQQITLLQEQLEATRTDSTQWRQQATYLLEDKSKKEVVINTQLEEQQALRERLAREAAEKAQLSDRLKETQDSLDKVRSSRVGRLLFKV